MFPSLKFLETSCDRVILQQYLVDDLHLLDTSINDPRGATYYKHHFQTAMMRVQGIFELDRSGPMVTCQVDDLSLTSNASSIFMHFNTAKILPLLWVDGSSRVSDDAHASLVIADDDNVHASLVIVDPTSHTFGIWDPNDVHGLTDEQMLESILQEYNWESIPMHQRLYTTKLPIQVLLEPMLPPSEEVPESGLCAIITALVFICSLRFNDFNVWHLSHTMITILEDMDVRQLQVFTRNMVGLYRRIISKCHNFRDIAFLLGYNRHVQSDIRPFTHCGVIDQTSQRICMGQSTSACPLCRTHLRSHLRFFLPQWPDSNFTNILDRNYDNIDNFTGCMFYYDSTHRYCERKAHPSNGCQYCPVHQQLWETTKRHKKKRGGNLCWPNIEQ